MYIMYNVYNEEGGTRKFVGCCVSKIYSLYIYIHIHIHTYTDR